MKIDKKPITTLGELEIFVMAVFDAVGEISIQEAQDGVKLAFEELRREMTKQLKELIDE